MEAEPLSLSDLFTFSSQVRTPDVLELLLPLVAVFGIVSSRVYLCRASVPAALSSCILAGWLVGFGIAVRVG